MTNIFKAFKDYKATHVPAPPAPGGGPRVWTPLLVETIEDRRIVLAKMRARYPELFAPPETPPAENPYAALDALAEASRVTPVGPCPHVIAQFAARPAGFRAQGDREDDPT